MSNSDGLDERLLEKLLTTKSWVEHTLPNMTLTSHNEFMHATVEICNNVRILLLVGMSLDSIEEGERSHGFTISQAPIVGLMVRIWKLYDQISYHVSQNHGEISSIFIRLIFEAYVKMVYMIKNPLSYESFIKTSFKSDIEMYKDLKPKEDKGKLDKAGYRILRSIERNIINENLDINELLQVNSRGWKFDGKDFRTLSKEILPDQFYSFIFSNSSSFVHGDWRDIKRSHITKIKGKYIPNPSIDDVNPHYVLPSSLFVLKGLSIYTKWAKTDPDNFLLEIINKTEEGIRFIDMKFEEQRKD